MLSRALSLAPLRLAASRSPMALRTHAVTHMPAFSGLRLMSQETKNTEKAETTETKAEEKKAEPSQEERATHKGSVKGGPMSWPAAALAVLVGGVTVYYFNQQMEEKKAKAKSAKKLPAVGTPLLGGPFELIDTEGATVTDQDFSGKYMLIYFGFTHCPDVCPDELNKIAAVYSKLESRDEYKGKLVPIFITIDPHRDTQALIKSYLAEFHEGFVGLTGSEEKIAEVCKAYRVYFSKGPVDVDEDYLVDHTIISYLVGPEGRFKEFYTKTCDAQEMLNRIVEQMDTKAE